MYKEFKVTVEISDSQYEYLKRLGRRQRLEPAALLRSVAQTATFDRLTELLANENTHEMRV